MVKCYRDSFVDCQEIHIEIVHWLMLEVVTKIVFGTWMRGYWPPEWNDAIEIYLPPKHAFGILTEPQAMLYGVLPIDALENLQQDAQLSQRDRTAGCIIVFAKSGRHELGDNILQTL